jgi:Pyruvate/2-oxoacid:ferredoxin oxidoreductase delta subunit
MSEEVYRKLAQRLDAIPNGFPATESGVELRLLAKIFTPEEAALASVMRLTYEPAAEIAARAGVEADAAYRTLKRMVRKGQILFKKRQGQLAFRLMPFVVGIYEEQLPRMDAELATLFEEYLQETQGGAIVRDAPPIHRVIPVEEVIPFDLEIFPYERASEMVEGAKSWGVRDCICRVQRRLIGQGCDHAVENCLLLAPVEGAFTDSETTRAITKEGALRILHEAEEDGLVHCPGNYRDGVHYICNCCTCSCGILRSVAEFGVPTAVARSDFRAVVEAEACTGCEECVERCQFGALAVPEDVCVVDYGRCVGCGVCAIACPADALRLERRPEEEISPPPADIKEWTVQRAQQRGISMSEVL